MLKTSNLDTMLLSKAQGSIVTNAKQIQKFVDAMSSATDAAIKAGEFLPKSLKDFRGEFKKLQGSFRSEQLLKPTLLMIRAIYGEGMRDYQINKFVEAQAKKMQRNIVLIRGEQGVSYGQTIADALNDAESLPKAYEAFRKVIEAEYDFAIDRLKVAYPTSKAFTEAQAQVFPDLDKGEFIPYSFLTNGGHMTKEIPANTKTEAKQKPKAKAKANEAQVEEQELA